jgi:diguanylate cyclase (GGDEF)-like protein
MRPGDSTDELQTKTAHLEAIEADLQLARELQQALLPQHYPCFPQAVTLEESALRFYHRYHSATALGGDFFSVQRLSDTAAGVFICDVMGHGVRPAMFTAMLRSLIEELAPLGGDPGQFLSSVNQRLIDILQRTGLTLFASAFYMIADAATGELRYANAGHPAPLHLRRGAGVVAPLPDADLVSGPALGVIEGADYPVLTCALAVHDVIMLFTDGLVEAKGCAAAQTLDNDANLDEYRMEDDREEYGPERLHAALRQRLHLPPTSLLDALMAEIQEFSGTSELEDDLCLIAMEVRQIGVLGPPVRDDLTGLFNRRYLEESLEREVHRTQRSGRPLGLIILAIDDFEQWSALQPEASTLLLQRVGELLLHTTRRSDIACHYTQAKFVLVLPEATLQSVERKAQQLHEAVSRISHEVTEQLPEMPLVLRGVSVFPDNGTTGEAIMQAAQTTLERDRDNSRKAV